MRTVPASSPVSVGYGLNPFRPVIRSTQVNLILDGGPNPLWLVIASTPGDLDTGLSLVCKSQVLGLFGSREVLCNLHYF